MSEDRPRVLVVEDDLLVAMLVTDLVAQCDCLVVGPVGSVGDALAAVREDALDGAVLDINLHGERVWPVAELLEECGIPFIFATGYNEGDIPERFRTRPRIAKPVTNVSVEHALRAAGTLPA